MRRDEQMPQPEPEVPEDIELQPVASHERRYGTLSRTEARLFSCHNRLPHALDHRTAAVARS